MAILVVLILPASHSALQAGQKAKCMSNLRNLYHAMLAFVEDYDGKLPPALSLGSGSESAAVDPRFNINQYWWGQAYLGRYAVGPRNRKRDSTGAISQQEAEIYNCPARFQDGPDSDFAKTTGVNPSPGISYLMAALHDDPINHRFFTLGNKSKKVFLTEGRSSTLWSEHCMTGEFGKNKDGKRLRRYHNGALNVLFYDGHVECFAGEDEELADMLPRKGGR